ncbi:unnamed protein product, partial [Pylaiella littoralis]
MSTSSRCRPRLLRLVSIFSFLNYFKWLALSTALWLYLSNHFCAFFFFFGILRDLFIIFLLHRSSRPGAIWRLDLAVPAHGSSSTAAGTSVPIELLFSEANVV